MAASFLQSNSQSITGPVHSPESGLPGGNARPSGAPSGSARPLRVLIVEDEAFVAMDAEAILQAAGHEVVGIALSADEAVALAAKRSPDLVLMDIRLRGTRDGIDAAIDIRRVSELPIIFVTANVDPTTHARAMQVSPLAVISKPFSSDSLLAAISAAL